MSFSAVFVLSLFNIWFFFFSYLLIYAFCLLFFFYHPVHNILKTCNVSVQVRFSTSKVVLYIQHIKHCMRVASEVAVRIRILGKEKLGKSSKISNLGGVKAQCQLSFSEIKFLSKKSKVTQKKILKFLGPVQFYLISLLCDLIFCWGLQNIF